MSVRFSNSKGSETEVVEKDGGLPAVAVVRQRGLSRFQPLTFQEAGGSEVTTPLP